MGQDSGTVVANAVVGQENVEPQVAPMMISEDFGAFLALLPNEHAGLPLRHAIEVRHDSFAVPAFYDLARRYNVAIVYAKEETFPEIDQPTADFTYARLMTSADDVETGVTQTDLKTIVKQARAWARRGDVFAYFIAGAKVRNPQAAQALITMLPKQPARL